ncbi:E3 SUMO-protein ligase PIAS1 [Candida albicans GC75]|nr:E3 SUMO-protein ligase PIAS1 [Candida albicans GC75]
MSTVPQVTQDDYTETLKVWRSFKVAQLKDVCRSLELNVGGRKQDLVDRGEAFLSSKFNNNDQIGFHAAKSLIFMRLQGDPLPSYRDMHYAIRTGRFKLTAPTLIGTSSSTNQLSNIHSGDSKPYKGHTLYFKATPLYRFLRLIHSTPMLLIPNGRNSVQTCHFIFTEEEYKFLQDKPPHIKLYILCGIPDMQRSNATNNVSIEYPVETVIYFNKHEFKDTFRGISGETNTAVPVDITKYINSPPQRNEIVFCHSANNAGYMMYLYLVEVIPAERLIEQVQNRPAIPKSETIRNIKDMSRYDGIQTTKLPLRDPLSYTKLANPTKSVHCDHYMCFNGMLFIEQQRLVDEWKCPVCSREIKFEDLRISEYFEEIIKNVGPDVDEIIIMQDGSWKPVVGDDTNTTKKRTESASPEAIILLSDDEDDVSADEVDANVHLENKEDESVNINRVDNTPEAEVDITESNNNQETQIDNESIQSDDLTEYLIDHEHQQHEEASDKVEDNNPTLPSQQSPQAETNNDETSNMKTTLQEDTSAPLPKNGVQENDAPLGDAIDTEQNLREDQTAEAVDPADSPISVINVTLDPPNEANKENSTESSISLSNLSPKNRESSLSSSSPQSVPPSMITPISPMSAQASSDKAQVLHGDSNTSNQPRYTSSPDSAASPLSLTGPNDINEENRTPQSHNLNNTDALHGQDSSNSQAVSNSRSIQSVPTAAVSSKNQGNQHSDDQIRSLNEEIKKLRQALYYRDLYIKRLPLNQQHALLQQQQQQQLQLQQLSQQRPNDHQIHHFQQQQLLQQQQQRQLRQLEQQQRLQRQQWQQQQQLLQQQQQQLPRQLPLQSPQQLPQQQHLSPEDQSQFLQLTQLPQFRRLQQLQSQQRQSQQRQANPHQQHQQNYLQQPQHNNAQLHLNRNSHQLPQQQQQQQHHHYQQQQQQQQQQQRLQLPQQLRSSPQNRSFQTQPNEQQRVNSLSRSTDATPLSRQIVLDFGTSVPLPTQSSRPTLEEQGSFNLNLLRHTPNLQTVASHSPWSPVATEPKNRSFSDSNIAVVNGLNESDPIEDRPLASLSGRSKSTNNMSNHNTSNVSSSNYQVSEKQQQVHRLQSINANSNKKEDTEVETTTDTNLQQGSSAENTTDEQNSFRCNVQKPMLAIKNSDPSQNHGQVEDTQTKNSIKGTSTGVGGTAVFEGNSKLQTNSVQSHSNSPRKEQNSTSVVPNGNPQQIVIGNPSSMVEKKDNGIDYNRNTFQIEDSVVNFVGRDTVNRIIGLTNLKDIQKVVENINNRKIVIDSNVEADRNRKRMILQKFDFDTKSLISDLMKNGGSNYEKSKLINTRRGEKSRLATHWDDKLEKNLSKYNAELQKLDKTLMLLRRQAESIEARDAQINGQSLNSTPVDNANSRGTPSSETDTATGQSPKKNHLVNIPPQTNQSASQNETLQLSSIVTPSNRDSSNKIRSGPPLQTSQVPTSKRQRVIGMLGIELNEDALKISDSKHGLQNSVTPINNKIKNISLDASNTNNCKDRLGDLQTQFSLNQNITSGTMHDPIVLDMSDEE